MSDKPAVLLCWGYNRIGWIELFERINPHFNFTYLFFYSKKLEDRSYTNNRKLYYNDFSGPAPILNLVKPSKIIFMGYDSPLTIGLNLYAKDKGITTYFMMHGTVSLNLEDYLSRKKDRKPATSLGLPGIEKIKQMLFTSWFLFRSVKPGQLKILAEVLRFRLDFNKYTLVEAFFKHKYHWRNPSKYIVFCKNDIDYYLQQDNAKVSDIIVIGNAESEPYFKYQSIYGEKREGYLLYLETPLSPIPGFESEVNIISKEEYNTLILRMNEYAKKQDLQLKIKLHPYNYKVKDFVQDENIQYLTDTDKVSLIMNANGVIGFDSSLLLTSVYFKNCCILINDLPNSFQKELLKAGFPYTDIKSNDPFPDFLKTEIPEEGRAYIKSQFLKGDTSRFPEENSATENLIAILNAPNISE